MSRFRLLTVLRLRELAERQARQTLAVAVGELAAAYRTRELAAGRLVTEEQRAQTRLDGPAMLDAVIDLDMAKLMTESAEREVARTAAAVEEQQIDLRAARSALEAVRRLRDRHVASERAEAERVEIIEAAEIATLAHVYRAEPS